MATQRTRDGNPFTDCQSHGSHADFWVDFFYFYGRTYARIGEGRALESCAAFFYQNK